MVIFTLPACCSGHGLPAVSLRLGNCGFLFFLISYVSGSSSKSTAVTRNRKCLWGTTQKTLFFPIWSCFLFFCMGYPLLSVSTLETWLCYFSPIFKKIIHITKLTIWKHTIQWHSLHLQYCATITSV